MQPQTGATAMIYNDREARLDTIAMHAWESHYKNGIGMDAEDRENTSSYVRDQANHCYQDDMTDQEWLNATLVVLNGNDELTEQEDKPWWLEDC
jgi:hypothetical protein